MAKPVIRTYSRYSQEALELMGKLIKLARKKRKLTAQDLAGRAGISRGLLQRIERGDPKCEIGATFEVATIVGVKLFEIEGSTLTGHIERIDDKLALLPRSVRKKSTKAVDDEF
ncbi:MAG: transcriptional regulator [Gammaproteobacteria bacterium]|nr:MAG: transcriptional regulator [Gammaproteobacteria bacterium]RLA50260.1 MAG: transcriptional regulator [Gammaproteobacteria bacterium]